MILILLMIMFLLTLLFAISLLLMPRIMFLHLSMILSLSLILNFLIILLLLKYVKDLTFYKLMIGNWEMWTLVVANPTSMFIFGPKMHLMNGDSVDDKASQCQSKLLCGQHNMLNLNGCDMNQRKMNLQKTIHTWTTSIFSYLLCVREMNFKK